ncbi:MAG: hypothetical protein JNM96_01615 [Bacteroidia bacterium]|nr:hypothetical protein [Bacteroidia bacterium]
MSATVLLSTSLVFVSCKKRDKKTAEEPDKEANTARDNASLEAINNDIDFMGSQLSENGSLSTYKQNGNNGLTDVLSIAPNATVTGFGTSTITVNFGSTPTLCQDGRKRSGMLFFDISSSTPTTSVFFRNPGFEVHVTSLNYVVDSNQVNIINKSVQNITPASIPTGTNPGTNLRWVTTANISVIKPNSGGTIAWAVPSRTIELINTNDANCYKGQLFPIIWSKAIVKINDGSPVSGTNAKGESYTAKAIDLIRDFNCRPSTLMPYRSPFVEGKIEYKPGSRATRLFDFGVRTSCDFNATVTINGVTYAITLP